VKKESKKRGERKKKNNKEKKTKEDEFNKECFPAIFPECLEWREVLFFRHFFCQERKRVNNVASPKNIKKKNKKEKASCKNKFLVCFFKKNFLYVFNG